METSWQQGCLWHWKILMLPQTENEHTAQKDFSSLWYNEHRIISLQQYTTTEFDATWKAESS